MSGGASASTGVPGVPARPTTNNANTGTMNSQHPPGSGGPSSGGVMSQTNLNQIVSEYLHKKGYTKTEAALRAESAMTETDGGALNSVNEDVSKKTVKAFVMLIEYVEGNLEYYKADLRRLLWPIFVHFFLNLINEGAAAESKLFFENNRARFENEHVNDLRTLQSVTLVSHITQNAMAKSYRENRYRLTLGEATHFNLIKWLESKTSQGGDLILAMIQQFIDLKTEDRAADDLSAFTKRLNRAKIEEDFPAEDEGIPGHNPGSANLERAAGSNVLTRVKLGPLPMEKDLMEDVRADLEDEDAKNPPRPGQDSLVQHLDKRIKREEDEEGPSQTELLLPPSRARDVAMEVQRIKEDRDRFKIEARTGGIGPGVSVTMFTFHNTYDSINCLDFSEDNTLVAAGFSESYVRVWSMDGKALPTAREDMQPSPSKRFIGHSGPVYGVAFSPSATSSGTPGGGSTKPKFLLSCSLDKTIRLWSLETWTALVVYKGHDKPVWDIKWGPFGHYFLSAGYEGTARMWRTDQIADLRMFTGHDNDVSVVEWHPNGAYVFTGGDDKTVRMFAVSNGYCVRLFTGHTGSPTALACSPNGKILASADDQGTIILWELASGRLKKRMRGHAKGQGIWSLSWSAESAILASGSGDGTVRMWDVDPPAEVSNAEQAKNASEGGMGKKIDASAAQSSVTTGPKKKGKGAAVTADQISAFPTKKSPVYKVRFTRMNLCIAGGAYLP